MEKHIVSQEEVVNPQGIVLVISTFNDGSQVIVEKTEE